MSISSSISTISMPHDFGFDKGRSEINMKSGVVRILLWALLAYVVFSAIMELKKGMGY